MGVMIYMITNYIKILLANNNYTYNQEEDLAIITQLYRYHTVSNNIKLKTGVFGCTRDGKSFLLKI